MRELMAKYSTERKLAAFLILLVTFTLVGPFGTYSAMTLSERFVFWSLIIASIGALMHFAIVLAIEAKSLRSIPRFLRIAIGSGIAAMPGAAVVVFLGGYMYETNLHPSTVPTIWMQIFVIGTLVGLVEFPPPAEEDQAAQRTKFHDRLPKGEVHDIISLTMNDHYVEVTTGTGTHLVLIRFSDALDELDGLEGFRLHRSHWAARKHIVKVNRSQKSKAHLSDGRILPISKRYVDEVSAAYP